jgi:hypothetical protein
MIESSPLFLSDQELIELTGRKTRRLQIEQLKRMLIAFRINAIGKPVVTRDAVIGTPATSAHNGWSPRAMNG